MTGQLTAAINLCDEIVAERWRQLKKWGPQSWPDGTGGWGVSAAIAQLNCDRAAEDGSLTWRHILEEEFYEALDETEYQPLRTELLQLAAVCLAWVEDLDNRAGDRARVKHPLEQLAANAELPEVGPA